jgi:hypothetical protein
MITTFLAPAVERVTMSKERSLWFQQDGATCHTARESMACLRQLFPGTADFPIWRLSLATPVSRVGSSRFFLWGYLKERVHQTKPRTLHELKDSIRREILSIQQETLASVTVCVVRRVQHCVALRGGHFSQVIFRT